MDHWVKRNPNAISDFGPLKASDIVESFVYFIGSEDGSRIKVGFSSKPDWSRIYTHAKGNAFKQGGNLEVLAVIRATGQCEKRIQNYFRKHLVPGESEVFFTNTDLLRYIVWLRDNYFVSTTKAEFENDSGRTVIEPGAWLPDDKTRRSDKVSDKRMLSLMNPWMVIPERTITGDDWFTPEEIVAVAKAALGGQVDLDPASNPIANGKYIKAAEFFTIGQNALSLPWKADRVFLNPPFSHYKEFASKVLKELHNGNMRELVMLGPNRILSALYFQALLKRAEAIGFISGRIPMWGIQADSSPVDGWFLIYVGAHGPRFLKVIETIGIGFRGACYDQPR